jgi:outer membrane protein assembly factor BamB
MFRSGLESLGPRFSVAAVSWTSGALDGTVYAEPLIIGEMVLVATENNTVYAINATDGTEVWHTNLGKPMQAASLPCGNIDPSGITGTPVVDVASGVLYVVAFTRSAHKIFAIDIGSGVAKWTRVVDPPGSDPLVQQQRAALALSRGIVYVAFGGLFGDCGDYHGWITGAPINGTGRLFYFEVPTSKGGGIWAPSGPAIDSSGNVLVATGNSFSATTFDFGESVLKLSPSLNRTDWFAPSDWSELNNGDTDLGSVGPTVLPGNVIFQVGKAGVGYLLADDHLGGIGGSLYSGKVCNGAYGGIAYSRPLLFIPCTDGLVALNVSLGIQDSFRIVWRGPSFRAGPPIISRGAVWTVDLNSGTFYALDTGTGSTVFSAHLGKVAQFFTPAAGNGIVIVVADQRVVGIGFS